MVESIQMKAPVFSLYHSMVFFNPSRKGLKGGVKVRRVAETLNFKFFNHVTRYDVFPVGDIEGHNVLISVREGAVIFSSGELAWMKSINYVDFVKAEPYTFDQYFTVTFQDGSRITCHNKGKSPAPLGTTMREKWAGEITNGTGRFQGIKGTAAAQIKFLPVEKDEAGRKALGEVTFDYTLPSK
jgi:hypothetical protein